MTRNSTSDAFHRPVPRRKVVTSGLTLGLGAAAAPLLSACSGGEEKEGSGQDLSSAGKPVEGGPSISPRSEVLYPEGYVGPKSVTKGVVTEEKATLTVVVPQDLIVGDWKKNKFTDWLEKRTNVKVDFRVIGGGGGSGSQDLMTKVNAMIASGDLPDAFMLTQQTAGSGFSHAQLQLYGQQGLFVPLNEIIDKYCPETQQFFKDYPDSRAVYTEPDGNIYTMPNMNDAFHTHVGDNRVFINKPWLEKLGFDVPQTLDEFEQLLRAYKSKDPNGNGKKDEIPFLANDSGHTFDMFIMGSFMYNPGRPWIIRDGDQLDVAFRQDGWRQGLRYLSKLYREELIDKQSFTRTLEQTQVLGNKKPPVIGAIRSYYWGGFIDIDQADPKAAYLDYVCLPTLKGPDGNRTAAWDYYLHFNVGNFVVTKASKIPEIAAMWADSQLDLDAILRAYIGPEDESWRFAKEGEKGLDGKQAVYNFTKLWPPEKGVAWSQAGLSYRSSDFRLGEAVDPKNVTFEKALYEQSKEAYYPYRQPQEMQVPPLKLSPDQAGQIADLKVTIEDYVSQSMAKFIKGDLDPDKDADWSKYLKTLDEMNLASYLKVQQDAMQS